jgi:FtsZ-binding cell division protein ZapB
MKKYLLFACAMLLSMPVYASPEELIESVKQKDLSAVMALLDNGENVNVANEQGNTPLHYAVALDNAEITKALLAKGADINAANAKGWTPLSIVEKKQLPNVAPILRKYLQQPDAIAKDTAKEIAARESNTAPVAQVDIESYKEIVARAKQEIISARQERDEVEAQNQALKKEIQRLKANNSTAKQSYNAAQKQAAQTPAPAKKERPKLTSLMPNIKKPNYTPEKSALDNRILTGDEEVVYCLNLLGQVDNPNMLKAAGLYAASAGINTTRFNQVVALSGNFFSTADEQALKNRSDTCGKIITPEDTDLQNQIIRSLNAAVQ